MFRGVRAATVLAFALAFALVVTGRAEVLDRIVATIDGEPITAHELRKYAVERGATGKVSESDVLDALITEKLMEKEASAQGIAARPDDIEQYIQQIKTRNRLDDERLAAALASQGMTMESYRAKVKGELEKAQLVNREIRQRVNVSPEEIQRYYQAHLDDYTISERVKVRDIFFAVDSTADQTEIDHVRQKAEEVRRMALDGRDFGKLAEQFSEGPGADKGGVLGTFARGEMDSELDEAAFKLKPKQVSEIIVTSRGLHIIRVDEVMGAGHKPIDEVKDEIREALYKEAVESRYESWLSRELRERHHVEIMP